MKTLLTFCLILIGLAGFTATGADASTVERTHARPAYHHHHHRYHHYYRHHHRHYYYRHHHRMYY